MIVVPGAVLREIEAAPPDVTGLSQIRQFVASNRVQVTESPQISPKISPKLDPGESEAITIALAGPPGVLLTDDADARSEAIRLGLPVAGTIGILRDARNQGFLTAVLPLVLVLRDQGQWIGNDLIDAIQAEEGAS